MFYHNPFSMLYLEEKLLESCKDTKLGNKKVVHTGYNPINHTSKLLSLIIIIIISSDNNNI